MLLSTLIFENVVKSCKSSLMMEVSKMLTRKVKRRVMIGLSCSILLCILILNSDNEFIGRVTPFLISSPTEDVSCYVEQHKGVEKIRIQGDGNIFFHETSCFGEDGIVITPRQACAVESAARMNPTRKIYFFLLSHGNFSVPTENIIRHLEMYDNIIIKRIFMLDYVKNTPLEAWWASGTFRSSRWPRSHMSDVLRYLTLWKFGGIYLDLDVVVTRSLEHLRNFAGAEDWEHVAAGVIGLDTDPFGRRVADACLRDLKKNFRGDDWGNNGPGVITRTLQKLCGTKFARDMNPTRCHGFMVYPPSTFYPIHYKLWKQYFEPEDQNNTTHAIENAMAIHVWNKLSQSQVIEVGSHVPYGKIASKYCPEVYFNCGKTF